VPKNRHTGIASASCVSSGHARNTMPVRDQSGPSPPASRSAISPPSAVMKYCPSALLWNSTTSIVGATPGAGTPSPCSVRNASAASCGASTTSVACRGPATSGLKYRWSVQVPPAAIARPMPQSVALDSPRKSYGSTPFSTSAT
jgi:hypothetical protein